MAYRVVITPPAKRRLDMYIWYTAERLKNRQAAISIRDDARETKKRLAETADSIKLCDNSVLAELGYHKFMFLKHDFLMLYRIDGDVVVVEGMYHELQDYEAIFINEMNL